jgi:cold shock protein
MRGTVRWYNQQKFYGFAICHEGNCDAFIHGTTLEAAGINGLKENDEIEFDVVKRADGKLKGINVKLVDASAPIAAEAERTGETARPARYGDR